MEKNLTVENERHPENFSTRSSAPGSGSEDLRGDNHLYNTLVKPSVSIRL